MTTDDTRRPPTRQVRAAFDDTTLIVYQAYPPQIADAALAAGTFVPPFKFDRMTWIKPSFLWMMYRSGWATKVGQERVLAMRITRTGFEQALSGACLSHYHPNVHTSHDDWRRRKHDSAIRVQWDPERSLHLDPLPWRTIQIGLSGTAVYEYASQWITDITDITDITNRVHTMRHRTIHHQIALPHESAYPLPLSLAENIGASLE